MELFVGKLVSVVALLSLAEAGFSPERAFSANVASYICFCTVMLQET